MFKSLSTLRSKSLLRLVTCLAIGASLAACSQPSLVDQVTAPVYYFSSGHNEVEKFAAYEKLHELDASKVDLVSYAQTLKKLCSYSKPYKGACATYGYYLVVYENGRNQAEEYFAREIKFYPEAKGYINFLRQNLKK
ncbi:hypothetical protein [Psittacicella hinzii]|uniref:Lipoprotein n=1 Tax=Psittacicella hinzii TaxID=2028575 RepID=A0A3A1YFV7_9GAMM|nr:hypothetical protein [Psittacicella hinzii]RIY37133.1 hypothetical protein CKF58_05265 [Psittacicella hinzii]